MATLAELQDALVNADKAGDVEAARQLADAIHAMRQVQATKPAAVQAGESIGGIPRQLGLAARYAMEGPAQFVQIGTEPIRAILDNLGIGGKSKPLSAVASDFADTIGLPKPQGANERVIGDASRLVAGAGSAGLAGKAAQGLGGLSAKIGEFFAANPMQQGAAAAGAGLAGGSVREAGGDPTSQAFASLIGGVATPLAAQGVGSIANAAKRAVTPKTQLGLVDQQISLTLRQQGIDWSTIPERVKQPMRAEVQQALNTGGSLNPDALRRLLDFQTVRATPTRGMLTQDPVQITREQNLAKTGANSSDFALQRLPALQNQNTSTLLSFLDDAGARRAPDAFSTGERVVGALSGNIGRAKDRIGGLYQAARDTEGRSAALDGATFTAEANKALDEALLGYAVPSSVQTHLNRIAKGEVPFTVDYAEQLKTAMGVIDRADKGGATSKAMGVIRAALDRTQLRPDQVNPQNLPAVMGTVPPSQAPLAAESIQAFNRARAANRGLMQRIEGSPALQEVYEGIKSGRPADPDRFVQRFITGQGASVADVRALQRATASSPEALQAVKQNIVSHLKNAATNNTDDIVKFSAAGYNRALSNIGERKLALFFEPEEIRQLQAVGRVGTLMTAQPAGSAVNNSNTGALMIGRAMSILDSIVPKLPLGLNTTIDGTLRGVQQSQALNVPKSLLLQQQESIGLLGRVAPPALYGGLLSTQPVD